MVRCDFGPDLQLASPCAQVLSGPQLKVNPASAALHLAVDVDGARVFLADARGHRVQAFGVDGRLLGTSASGELNFPNRLRWAPDGRLMVADNDNRRVVWFEVMPGSGRMRLDRTLASSDHAQARTGHRKVTDFALSSAAPGRPMRLWMLALAAGQRDGDVLVWGDDGKGLARAVLPADADPLIIEAVAGHALVADFGLVDLYQIGPDGAFLGRFGDAALQSEFQAQRRRLAQSDQWSMAGWGLFGMTLVLGFGLALKFDPPRSAARPAPPGAPRDTLEPLSDGETVWLAPERWFVRHQRALAVGVVVLVVVALGALALLQAHRWEAWLTHSLRWLLWATVGMAVGATALVLRAIRRAAERGIVVTSAGLRVAEGSALGPQVAMEDVRASPMTLLIGGHTLNYRLPGPGGTWGWIYPEGELRRLVLSRLQPTQWLSPNQLLRAAWQRLPRARRWALVAIGLLVVAVMSW